MRRIPMLVVVAVALLTLGAAAALAQEDSTQEPTTPAQDEQTDVVPAQNQVIRCLKVPCYGTGSHDLIYERKGNGKRDRILLSGGDDQVRADRYTSDQDVIEGSAGFDLIYVNDGDTRDKIWGGKGNDKCYVDARSEVGGGCSRIITR